MKNKVENTIKKHNLIDKEDNVLLGVSGGPDSMALLNILYELNETFKCNLYVAHINHGIRGEEADKDEVYVERYCRKFNIPFYLKRVNMNEYAKKHKLSSEEAGREIRYKFFEEILIQLGGGKIAVAHNKNDQAETLIMRFIRGTGLDGLKGMKYKNSNIIRPLLDISRNEIEKYCDLNNINPRIDRSNLETIYERNKIRLELIPYLEKNFNTGIIDTLVRTSKVMQEDSYFLNEYAKTAYEEVVFKEQPNNIMLINEKFTKLNYAIKCRVLRRTIKKINGHLKGIEEKHVSSIIDLSSDCTTGKRIYISSKIIARICYNYLVIEKDGSKHKDSEFNVMLNNEGITWIEELDSFFEARVVTTQDFDLKIESKFIKKFDYDKVRGSLFVRNRRKGDKFIPIGMKGSKKIKDFFIDEKIPREEREKIPLVVNDEDILWVVGYRISEKYKITDTTKRVLILEYKKQK